MFCGTQSRAPPPCEEGAGPGRDSYKVRLFSPSGERECRAMHPVCFCFTQPPLPPYVATTVSGDPCAHPNCNRSTVPDPFGVLQPQLGFLGFFWFLNCKMHLIVCSRPSVPRCIVTGIEVCTLCLAVPCFVTRELIFLTTAL